MVASPSIVWAYPDQKLDATTVGSLSNASTNSPASAPSASATNTACSLSVRRAASSKRPSNTALISSDTVSTGPRSEPIDVGTSSAWLPEQAERTATTASSRAAREKRGTMEPTRLGEPSGLEDTAPDFGAAQVRGNRQPDQIGEPDGLQDPPPRIGHGSLPCQLPEGQPGLTHDVQTEDGPEEHLGVQPHPVYDKMQEPRHDQRHPGAPTPPPPRGRHHDHSRHRRHHQAVAPQLGVGNSQDRGGSEVYQVGQYRP